MPIYLQPPTHNPKGPDRRGWNRLSLNAHMGTPAAQCARRPRTWGTLIESQNTVRSAWGSYGRCISDGDCGACPLPNRAPRQLDAEGPRILVRLRRRHPEGGGLFAQAPPDEPWVMVDPDSGWDSPSEPWSWEDLARVPGWMPCRRVRDEHGEGFWLIRC